MNKGVIGSISLLVGGGMGFLIGYKVTKKKYRKIADEEVESVKKALEEYYRNPSDKRQAKPTEATEKKEATLPVTTKDSIDYSTFKGDNEKVAYSNYVNKYKSKEEKPATNKTNNTNIYIISSDDFASGEYDVETLNYYADGVLADDDDNIIQNVKSIIGDVDLSSILFSDEQTAYIRNDIHQLDYEILYNDMNYTSINPGYKNTNGYAGEDRD